MPVPLPVPSAPDLISHHSISAEPLATRQPIVHACRNYSAVPSVVEYTKGTHQSPLSSSRSSLMPLARGTGCAISETHHQSSLAIHANLECRGGIQRYAESTGVLRGKGTGWTDVTTEVLDLCVPQKRSHSGCTNDLWYGTRLSKWWNRMMFRLVRVTWWEV